MKSYTVEWLRGTNAGLPPVTKYIVEADDVHDAFNKATGKYKLSAYRGIFISWDDGNERFDNPHYDHNYVDPAKAVTEKIDGSVGWYENLGESSFSDRDILLAQLHELRTIKRCVVGTVVIAIVIPLIVGGIISG
jgi:hypothetical protein